MGEGSAAMTMTNAQITEIITAITGVINVTTVVGFIATILATAAVFVLMWFGIRKALRAIMGSVKKGRVGV